VVLESCCNFRSTWAVEAVVPWRTGDVLSWRRTRRKRRPQRRAVATVPSVRRARTVLPSHRTALHRRDCTPPTLRHRRPASRNSTGRNRRLSPDDDGSGTNSPSCCRYAVHSADGSIFVDAIFCSLITSDNSPRRFRRHGRCRLR